MKGRPRSSRARAALITAGFVLVSPLIWLNLVSEGGDALNVVWLRTVGCILPGLASAACFARAASGSADRLAWRLIGTGLAFRAAGSIGRHLFLDVSQGRDVPAWVDPLFLAMYPFVFAGLILVLRNRLRTYRHIVLFDSIAGFVLLVALCFTFFPDQITDLTGYDELGTAVLLSYPLGDISILVLTICLFRFKVDVRDGPWLAFGAGLTLIALGDLYLAFATPSGGQAFGVLNGVWFAGFLFVIYGAWQPDGDVIEIQPGLSQVTLPLAFLAMVVGALLYGQAHDLWDSAVVLLAVVAALVLVRLAITAREYAALARTSAARSLDRVTGLPSRERLEEWLKDLAAAHPGRRSSLYVLVIAVDRLGQTEAALGPVSVDGMISIAATRLRRSVAEIGHLAAIGRGQFALLCSEEIAPEPKRVADQVFRLFRHPVRVGGINLQVDLVIGGARAPGDADDPRELLHLALVSCDEARAIGESLRISPREPDRGRKSLQRIEELRAGIRSGQLRVHFQPKVRTDEGAVRCVEALVRWDHPRIGELAPTAFVPLAERSGLMPGLTDVVADLALAQAARWRKRGIDLGIAINLGMSDLMDQGLVGRLRAACERHRLEANRVTLEVSEDLVTRRPEQLISNLGRLRDAGFRVSLDDFGSGSTTLAYLRTLPLDEVKIDRSLISSMHLSEADAIVCEAAIAMINGLSKDVVAEGAEEPWTVNRLSEIGCREIQSFYFARPMPADELESWLRDFAPAR